MPGETLRILSIDGGGIRGLIPALVLLELENRLGAAGKDRQLYKHFDLIAGTSTGGIIAAGLTAPNPANKTQAAMDAAGIVSLYRDEGDEIFSRDRFRRIRESIFNPALLSRKNTMRAHWKTNSRHTWEKAVASATP